MLHSAYSLVEVQIKVSQLYDCLRSLPPSGIFNLGLVGLVQISKWEIRVDGVLQMKIPTRNSKIPTSDLIWTTLFDPEIGEGLQITANKFLGLPTHHYQPSVTV